MKEGKYFFDSAMNKDKSNTDKIIEIMNSFNPTGGVTVIYDVDYRPDKRLIALRLALLAALAACLARWLAGRRS